MKIAFGLVAVLVVLLGMIAAVGHLDGSITFGEPSPTTNPVQGNSPAQDVSAITGEEKAYLEFVVNIMQSTSSDISTLGMLFSNPELEDEYWKASVTVLLNRIEAAHGSVIMLQPTSRLQPFQDASVEALDHSGQFVRILRSGLVQGSTELSGEAAVELMQAADSFGVAEDWLNEFLRDHPVP